MAEEESETSPGNDREEPNYTKLSEEFSAFLKVDTTKQVQDVENMIDAILAKLEEFCTVVELMRVESKDVLFGTLPVLHDRCEQIQPICQQIDYLEKFIGVVRGCVEDAEEKVNTAEKELSGGNFKKLLHNVPVPKFLARKKEIQPYLKKDIRGHDYKAPITFKTDDYFKKYQSNDVDFLNTSED